MTDCTLSQSHSDNSGLGFIVRADSTLMSTHTHTHTPHTSRLQSILVIFSFVPFLTKSKIMNINVTVAQNRCTVKVHLAWGSCVSLAVIVLDLHPWQHMQQALSNDLP